MRAAACAGVSGFRYCCLRHDRATPTASGIRACLAITLPAGPHKVRYSAEPVLQPCKGVTARRTCRLLAAQPAVNQTAGIRDPNCGYAAGRHHFAPYLPELCELAEVWRRPRPGHRDTATVAYFSTSAPGRTFEERRHGRWRNGAGPIAGQVEFATPFPAIVRRHLPGPGRRRRSCR